MTDTTKKFYVYVHKYASGPKKGHVFYVGKGCGRRYTDIQKRSKWWNYIVLKYGFTSEILCMFRSEVCALTMEKVYISIFGRGNLCNLTDGGEGMSGWVPSGETRAKWSKIRRGRALSDSHKAAISIGSMGRCVSASTRRKLSALKAGENHHYYGCSPEENPRYKPERYWFIHDDFGVVHMNRQEMIKGYGLNPSKVSSLILGGRKKHKGWTLHEV